MSNAIRITGMLLHDLATSMTTGSFCEVKPPRKVPPATELRQARVSELAALAFSELGPRRSLADALGAIVAITTKPAGTTRHSRLELGQ